MALDKKLFKPVEAAAANGGGTGNQEEGLILHLDANDVDSYDGDGSIWYDITNHEYTPATNVSEHFNTVLYTGNGSTNAITGVGFQPDLVWIKNRDDSTASHALVDSVRGLSASGTGYLRSDTTDEESVTTNMPSSLDSDGFTAEGNQRFTNENGDDYVAWCFKAGGAPTATNTATSGAMTANSVSIDGTLESAYTPTDATIYPKKISANTKLGFSTVLFEGTGNSNNRVPHGLGVPPELIIYKNIDEARSWVVGTDAIGWNNTMKLEDASAAADRAYFDDIKPTSNVFEIYNGQANTANDAGSDFIAYCFASKRGVSKVGSYTGTGSSGNKIYTGFEPAWILVKKTNGTGSWEIIDNKRGGNKKLYPDLNNTEFSSSQTIEFNRDGFTLDGTGANASSSNYIYLAFAKDTNETSLIPDTDLELHLDAASFPQKGESGYSNTPSTWTDSSGNSNNGTISGATFDSELGNWLDFNSTTNVVTLNSTTTSPIDPSSSFSIETWVNHDDLTGHQTYVSKYGGTSATQSYIFGLDDTTNKPRFVEGTGSGFNIRKANTALAANKWHHIVVTSDSSKVIFYIDGEEEGTISRTQTRITGGTQSTTISKRATSTTQTLDGKIGQVRMYSTALTQDQVRQNFNFTKNDYPNGLNASLQNGASWNSSGYMALDGVNDKISIPDNNALSIDSGDQLSFNVWFKDTENSSDYRVLLSKGGSNKWEYALFLYLTGTNRGFNFSSYYNGASNIGVINVSSSNTWISTNTWHNVTITIDEPSETAKVYIDGVERATDTNWTYGIWTNNDPFIFGGRADLTSNFFQGRVSKFKLYDKVLTQAEITALYNEGE